MVAIVASPSDPDAVFGAAGELQHLSSLPAATLVADARRALDEEKYDRAAALAALAGARSAHASDTAELAEASRLLGLARFRNGQPDEAIAPFTRAAHLLPSSATVRFNLAAALYRAGHLADAEQRWVEAARDDKLAGLSLYDAGLAALDGGHADRAAVHFAAAEKAARAAGQAPVADEAHAAIERLTQEPAPAGADELARLTRAGNEALREHRYADAADTYRRALDIADAAGAPAADRAELHYDVGNALYRAGDLLGAARALVAAIELEPGDAEFHYLLGLVHFDAGADEDAKIALDRAIALGLPAGERARAGHLERALERTRRNETSRLFLELRLGAGYDTNVPQSGVLTTAARGKGEPSAAPLLDGDLDFFWRPAGTARNGFSLEYRFGQLAYLSDTLDLYSLQEHDLTLSGAWTPTPRLTLELGADGYVLFSGVETFGLFQAGGSVGPRLTVRETHGLETRVRYQHIFKQSLDRIYDYLGGERDEAAIAETWRNPSTRVALAYLFGHDGVGTQKLTLADLDLPLAPVGSYDPNAVYFIPYSNFSHEVSLGMTRELPRDFRGTATARYEHRDYPQSSHIAAPNGTPSYYRLRRDDRFGLDLAMRHPIGAGFDVELAYTFILNHSTIDNTRPSTPLDYDDKSYTKHMIQLGFGYVY
jgi:tetratricopeptide (TPR) repeat protein